MIVGQGPIVLAVNAVQVVGTFFSIVCNFSFLSPSLSFKTVFSMHWRYGDIFPTGFDL